VLFIFIGLKFVVVCRQKAAFHSHLVSALDRYKTDMSPLPPERIKAYLKHHFRVDDVNLISSAGRVDSEK